MKGTHPFRFVWLLLGIVLPFLSAFAQIPNGIGSGNSYYFDGNNDYVSLGDTVADGVRTIELWVKPDTNILPTSNGVYAFVSRDYLNGNGASLNEFGIYFAPTLWNSGGKIQFYRRTGSVNYRIDSDSGTWYKGAWIHVAGVIDPQTGMKLYINGVLQQDTNSSTSPIGNMGNAATDEVAIGRWGAQTLRHYKGEIDEFRMWTTARSQKEIRQYMCRKLVGNENGLRAYYRFDESSGLIANDASGNGWDGVINGTAIQTSSAPIGDTSTNLYNDSIPWLGWNNASLKLAMTNGDSAEALNLSATQNPFGIHLYRIDSTPNTNNGLTGCFADFYFGAFVADYPDTANNYDLVYHYNTGSNLINSGNEVSAVLFDRHNNASDPWAKLAATTDTLNDEITKPATSYRAEYILGFSADVPDLAICEGQSLSCIVPSPLGANYLWPDSSTADTFCTQVPGNYTVQVSHPGGCVEVKSFKVLFSAGPYANLGQDTVTCPGDTICLSLPPAAGNSYNWTNGSTTNMACLQSGSHSVIVTDSIGCTRSDSINIGVADPTVAAFSSDTIECQSFQFTDSSSGHGSLTYQWNFGDGDSSNVSSPMHVYQTNGTFVVQLTVTSDCGSHTYTDSVTVTCINTSSTTNGSPSLMKLFPNPNNGLIYLEFPSHNQEFEVLITDLKGRLLMNETCSPGSRCTLSHDLTAGLYLLMVDVEGREIVRKLLVD